MIPEFSGCDWPLDAGTLNDTWAAYDEAVQERATSLASATLYRLCGYRMGGCPVTVRPVRQNGSCGFPDARSMQDALVPYNLGGNWSNVYCGTTLDPRLVELPAPVGRVDEVKVDGVVLDETDYSIADDHFLAWVGTGDVPWLLDQDWLIPDTEVGTFSVTYLNSYPVDGYGAIAAALLAMEFAKALKAGGKQCKLPTNVISIVRQGVSYEMAAGAFPDGKTSIREIDGFIETWNPKARVPGQVIIPGERRVHVVVPSGPASPYIPHSGVDGGTP